MHSSRVQSLIVLSDPVCLELLFRLEDGPAPLEELADAVDARLGVDPTRIPAYLDGLVGIGFAGFEEAEGGDGPLYVSLGVEAFRARNADAWRHIHWLHCVGDNVQADDLALALDAAWDARSADPVRRRRAALFRDSAAGGRHRRRLLERTLGVAFADVVVSGDLPAGPAPDRPDADLLEAG